MKRWYPALILLCLLLAGCSGKGRKRRFPPRRRPFPWKQRRLPGCMTRMTRWKCVTATPCGRTPERCQCGRNEGHGQ
ncbi:MAG: hypothetical protein ACLUFI_09010 [Oscillospiraceae bacterium]